MKNIARAFCVALTWLLLFGQAFADSQGSATGGTAGTQSTGAGCINQSPSLSSGQQATLACDANGNLNVNVKSESGAIAIVTPTNDSLSLTTGGTAQNAIAANATRKGCTIQNPATAADQGISTAENLYVRFGGTAAAASDSWELVPGQSMSCAPVAGQIVTTAVSVVAATTAHKIIVVEYN